MSWQDGYVTDIGYTYGYYRELTPALLQTAALGRGMRGPEPGAPLNYCELGCGQGFSASLIAAANPHVEYYATDFNPAHIAWASGLAKDAECTNIHLYDDSFAEFLVRDDLPKFDIISLHGIYSWIAAEHRHTIVEFIRRKLKPGGLVYISYNTLPGWSAAAPMRHLMYLHGKAQGGSTIARLDPALAFIEKLIGTDAKFFAANAALKTRFEQISKQNRNYLAHEYMNDAWTLLYHSDVAAELAAAKLNFLGSAHLLDFIDAINFTPPQKALFDEVTDPVLRETVRDYLTNQQFRRDVFVKGATSLPASVLREAWLESRFALSTAREDVPMKVRGALGDADLHADVYGPVLDGLANGPVTLRQLLVSPPVAALGWNRLIEALTILVGGGHVQPCLPAKSDAKRSKSARAFNQAVMRRARDNADLGYLASPVTGGGIAVPRFSQLFLLALSEGRKTAEDCAAYAWQVLSAQGQLIVKEGNTLRTPEENLAELRPQAETFLTKQLPVLRTLQVA